MVQWSSQCYTNLGAPFHFKIIVEFSFHIAFQSYNVVSVLSLPLVIIDASETQSKLLEQLTRVYCE